MNAGLIVTGTRGAGFFRSVVIGSTAERIARQMMEGQGTLAVAQARAAVAERMTARIGFVGSNPATEPTIEGSFKHALALVEAHLQARPYLLGGRPALADFGLWGQLYELATDPTPGAIMRVRKGNTAPTAG